MARITLQLGRGFGRGRASTPGMQSLVNMYVEPVEGEQRSATVCYPTPGKALFSTVGGGAVRGQYTASDTHYAVVGASLYKLTAAGVTTNLGQIEGTKPVDMSYNGTQLCIVAELKSYFLDHPTAVLTEISGGGFEQATSTASVASYTLTSVKDSGRFRWTLVNNLTFPTLNFATAEAESDFLVAIRKIGNEVALLGTSTVEVWGTTGSTGADAFARVSTAAASIGCVARDSAVVVDNALTWVGRDGSAGGLSVYRMEGYQPRKISSPQVDNYLERVSDLTTLRAFSYQQRGHLFYVLTADGEWTLAWDVSTQIWSYRKSGTWPMGSDPTGGWDAVTMTLNAGRQIVGSADGNLYELQADTLTEAGSGIVREVTTAQISDDGRRMFNSRLELDIEAGVGTSTGAGAAPVVMESHSDDGGKTWSSPRQAGMGAIGQNKWRAVWLALGSFRNRMFRFRVSDPVEVVFLSATADVTQGMH